MELSEFNEKLRQGQRPVVVDLWAPWCGPCMAVKPTLEKLAAEYAGRVDLWQINADDSAALLQTLRVYGIPTLIVYRDGKETTRHVGAKPASALRSMFESLATGQALAPVGVTTRDRVLRMGAGLAIAVIAWQFSYWPLLILGGLVIFTAVYDRCPIWRALTSGFSRLFNRA